MIPDDFQKGKFITILRGCPLYQNWDKGETLTITGHDKSWKGDVLEIVHVEYPFIVCKNLTSPFYRGIHSFDIREYQFKALSDEYVVAMEKENP